MAKRAYDNSRRLEQSRQTRETIVHSMVELLAKGDDDVSVAELAERSGVARRTVYHHFPDKASRVQALNDWVDEQVDADAVLPRGFDDVPAYVERLVGYVLDHEPVMRAQMAPGLSKAVRSYRKRAHVKSLRSALRERIRSNARVDRLVATIVATVRAEAIFDLRDLYGQSRPQTKRSLRRLVELLLADAVTS